MNKSPKSRLVALLLCLFLGGFGAHRFYVGKIGTAILIIITFGGFFGIWPLIDLIVIAVGSFKDKEGRTLSSWSPNEDTVPTSTVDKLSGLEKLADLKSKGIITEEEFAKKKRELLA